MEVPWLDLNNILIKFYLHYDKAQNQRVVVKDWNMRLAAVTQNDQKCDKMNAEKCLGCSCKVAIRGSIINHKVCNFV